MSRPAATRDVRWLIAVVAAASLSSVAVAQQPAPVAVKLMVLKEVDSSTAHSGDRFRLRVNEAVVVDGATVIPVGANAWAEVTFVDGTGAVGNKGRLTARLLYVDAPTGRLSITGEQGVEGKANTAGVAIAVVSFGLLGLLTKGGNAHFKAGDILTGYLVTGGTPRGAMPVPGE